MGDAAQAKVHVHTDAPERAAEAAGPWGEVAGLRVDDMRRQEAERDARLRRAVAAGASCAAVALVAGEGMRELAEGLGAGTLDPAAGAGEIAAALQATGAPEGVVVTAGPEGLAAARAAVGGAVVDAGSLPGLLACLVGLEGGEVRLQLVELQLDVVVALLGRLCLVVEVVDAFLDVVDVRVRRGDTGHETEGGCEGESCEGADESLPTVEHGGAVSFCYVVTPTG